MSHPSPGDLDSSAPELDDTPVPPGARRALWIVAAALVLIMTVWVLTSCSSGGGGGNKLDISFSTEEQHLIDTVTISPDELAAADGSGENAWVAVDGVVYDIGEYGVWQRGSHYGVQAGTDATAAFEGSPHGADQREAMPVVGSLGE